MDISDLDRAHSSFDPILDTQTFIKESYNTKFYS